MLEPITLRVYGTPVPQGSKKGFVNPKNGRVIITEAAGSRHKAWRQAVTEVACEYMREHSTIKILDEPLTVNLAFYFLPPVGDPYRVRHCVTPDRDKLERSVNDSLTDSGLIKDDSRIWRGQTSKEYVSHSPGVLIHIYRNGEAEKSDQASRKAFAKGERK